MKTNLLNPTDTIQQQAERFLKSVIQTYDKRLNEKNYLPDNL
jgi:hypothetical protein